jgi:hypothetical protein
MAVSDNLFNVFAFLTLACGVLVVANPFSPNTVSVRLIGALTPTCA